MVLLALLGLGGWLAVTGYNAKGELEQARTQALGARTAVVAGDPTAAHALTVQAASASAAARGNTSTLPWHLISAIPWVGQPFDTVRQISAAVDDLAKQVLLPAADVAQALSPSKLRGSGGQIDIAALNKAAPTLRQASDAATDLQGRVDQIPSGGYVGAIEDARVTLQKQTGDLTSLLQNTSTAATLLPSMLGGQGARSYFVAFQTNAEARGTGGLVGAFGILRADGGRTKLDDQAANTSLKDGTRGSVNPGPDFQNLYGRYDSATRWINSNLTADFPTVGSIWTSLWAQQSGQQLDGAIATDPVALSYLLGATGPVTLADGQVVSADNVVQLTEADVYVRFADNGQRKAYLQAIASAVLGRVASGGGGDTTAVVKALGRAAGEGRLAVWSSHAEEQAVLTQTPLARQVPDDPAPYAGLSVNNSGNGKLDYYLGRGLSYRAGTCDGPTRSSTVTATLTSSAPAAGLPGYVTIQGTGSIGPPGTNRSNIAIYATQGALLTAATLNGQPVSASVGNERGHPVFTFDVVLPPGATVVLVLDLVEPTAPGPVRMPVQPLVQPMTVESTVPVCRAT